MRPRLSTPSLARRHWKLLTRCLAMVAAFRIGLCIMPYRKLVRWMPPVAPHRPANAEVQRVIWGVLKASKAVPQASCLTQALAAQYLCARVGHSTRIRIGVALERDGKIKAHAWLIDDSGVLIGGEEDLSRFARIVDLDIDGVGRP